jgi:cytochrome c oxidase subunit 2
MSDFALSLPEASENARSIDVAFVSVLGIAGAIFLLLCVLLVLFAVRYRRGSTALRGPLPKLLQREIEIGWTTATIFLALFIFWWFVGGYPLPARGAPGQLELHVVAKQWMWKTEHANGAREINALHIPVGRPIRLVMTSQDVIHSFFVPAFRLKQDLLPDRSTELVFTASKPGTYHLFCAEFCGTQHSHMTGEIVVLSAGDYDTWLGTQPQGETVAEAGAALYAKLGCDGCHVPEAKTAPALDGLYGSEAELADGRRVIVDESYLRRALLTPREQQVSGYAPVMPSYGALLNPSDVESLVAYLKTLSNGEHRQ